MIGLWLEDGALRLATDLPRPQPATGEALVRVELAGICNTDLELIRGYYPYTGILGHEFVGVVEDAPPGFEQLAGRRVVGDINASCGECPACTAGRRTHCENRTVLGIVDRDGAFAEYLTLPAVNLHMVPDSVPDEAAVFTEPLAAALQIQEQVEIGREDRILVVGDGKLGQLIARTLNLAGGHLCVVGRHESKLAMLAALDIETSMGEPSGSAATNIAAGSFDIAVECTGNADGFALARRALRPRGTLVLKSTYAGNLELDISSIVVDEIRLVGSRCGPFAAALDVLKAGHVEVADLIDDRYPLSAAIAAFEHARQRGSMKILLETT